MAVDEFTLIDRYFSVIGKANADTRLAVGDDAAVVALPQGRQLVVSLDTLIDGVHFGEEFTPADIAYKSLAVNLSDLAAMAADPAWFLLSLSLPRAEEAWLSEFSAALKQTADRFQVELIGGDTCRGSLAITIQVGGHVPEDAYVTRAGAQPGDLILVSGEIGNAALGLAHLQGGVDLPAESQAACIRALKRPRPRLELIPFLREFARAAIDISDGLQADLGHILDASGCGASLNRDLLPVNGWIRQSTAYRYALDGGDDYEICCCISTAHLADIEIWNRTNPDCRLTVIGEITESGYTLEAGKERLEMGRRGYRHFE